MDISTKLFVLLLIISNKGLATNFSCLKTYTNIEILVCNNELF